MAYDLQAGTVGLRGEVIDEMVKQVAMRTYKMKQLVAVVPSSDWSQTFFRENPTILTGPSGNSVRGLPQGANFPQASVGFEKVTVRIVKFGLEENIPWEAIISGQINIQARTVIRITEAVVKGVDDEIWDGLTESRVPSLIQSFNVESAEHGAWNESSAAIIDDLMYAKQLIGNYYYPTENLTVVLNDRDHRSIVKWITDKGTQFQALSNTTAVNGAVPGLAGMTFIVSPSVTTSWALVCVPKTCATWKELVPLRSVTVEDPLRSWKVRVAEEGVLELTDPKAIVAMRGTLKA